MLRFQELSPVSSTPETDDQLKVFDISHLAEQPEAQHNILKRSLEKHGTMQHAVFRLRGRYHERLAQMAHLKLNVNDIDGTLTGIGTHNLYPSAVEGIGRLRGVGLPTLGLTGRHLLQIQELWDAHGADGIRETIGEQGALLVKDREYHPYLGNDTILAELGAIRSQLDAWFAEIGHAESVTFIPTSGGHHKFQYSRDAHTVAGTKITDKEQHERIASRVLDLIGSNRTMFEGWNPGTSSTGTFEMAHHALRKDLALERYLREHGIRKEEICFKGDSGNDMSVFNDSDVILKTAVVNSHTKPELIAKAHFATVGEGNAAPMFELIAKQRRAA